MSPQDEKPYSKGIRKIFEELSQGTDSDVSNVVSLMGWKNGDHHDASEFFYFLNEKLDMESELLLDFLTNSFQIISENGLSRSVTLSTTLFNTLEEALVQEPDSILLPKRIFISLNRVNETGSQRSSEKFMFPFKFGASKIMTGACGVYLLHAVIAHGGNALHGHYKIVVKDKQIWREISDLNSEVIEEEHIGNFFGGGYFVASNLIYELID